MLNLKTSTVLLYHSISEYVKYKENFHNVSFYNFSEQINFMKDNYKIEAVDEIHYSKHKKTAAITFDDGYKELIHKAIPFLEKAKVPYTIFWNPNCSNLGFWRDKLRFILNDMELRLLLIEKVKREIDDKSINLNNIYKKSKASNINNRLISNFCDEILESKKYKNNSELFSHDDLLELCKNTKFLKIGNHSLNHFNLASLDKKDLINEIKMSKILISKLPKSKISNIFSIPFGGNSDINDKVIKTISKFQYNGLLMSRNMININHNYQKFNMPIIERFMPKDLNLKQFKSQLLEVKTKTFIKSLIKSI